MHMFGQRSQLHLKSKRRNGERFSDGTFQSERRYVGFVIEGTSLSEIVSSARRDLVSVMTKERVPEEREKSLRWNLLLEPAHFPTNASRLWFAPSVAILGARRYPHGSSLRKKRSLATKIIAKKNFTSMGLRILDHTILHHERIKDYWLLPCCS